MTRRTVTLISIAVLIVGLISAGGIIGCAAEAPATLPATLPETANAIAEGTINVGNEYGLAPDQRYHNIHTTVLGLECATCHITKVDATNRVVSAWKVSPRAPGPVDQRGCLGCHNAGPGNDLYGFSGP